MYLMLLAALIPRYSCTSHQKILASASYCIKRILQHDYHFGGDEYMYNFLGNVYRQWNAYSNKKYLWWPHHDGIIVYFKYVIFQN